MASSVLSSLFSTFHQVPHYLWGHGRTHLKYTSSYTREINHFLSLTKQLPRLPPTTLTTLKDFGISRSFRGSRGGRKSKSQRNLHIPVRISTNYAICSALQQKAFNRYHSTFHSSQILRNLVDIQRAPIEASTTTASSKLVDLVLLNSRSIRNKTLLIKDFVVDHNIDLLALTETWLRQGDEDQTVVNEICPSGYNLLHVPRVSRAGGGVALMYKRCFKIIEKPLERPSFSSFEHILLSLRYSSTDITLVIVYRPPHSNRHNLSTTTFFEEFAGLLERLVVSPSKLLILGDFNFHANANETNAVQFLNLLDSFNLNQRVSVATHKSGHTLDLVICREDEKLVTNLNVNDHAISTLPLCCALLSDFGQTCIRKEGTMLQKTTLYQLSQLQK